jgi:hypothetical protein
MGFIREAAKIRAKISLRRLYRQGKDIFLSGAHVAKEKAHARCNRLLQPIVHRSACWGIFLDWDCQFLLPAFSIRRGIPSVPACPD